MPSTRKLLRDTILTALAHATNGFNAKLAAIAGTYGVTAFALSFAASSRNVFQGFLTTESVDLSQFKDYPALAVYTSSSSSDTGDANRQKFRKFSGTILAHLDFYIKYKTGVEVDNTESIADAIEDACIEMLSAATWPTNVAYNGDFRCDRDPVTLLGDGWGQRIPITLTFGVHVS